MNLPHTAPPDDRPRRSGDRFLVYGSPALGEEEIDEVVATLRSGWLGTGPKCARFEQDFADYKQVPHAVAVNSCTAALHLSLLAAGVGAGDEVVTTPLTFCATANSILHTGATPVVADVDPLTMNVDLDALEAKITPRTKALLPVHFAGRPVDLLRLRDIADRHGLALVEDCAHAIETEFRGHRAGTVGDFGCFSFYVTKNVVTGEGGMVTARDPAAAERVKVLALHGMSKDAWRRFSDDGYRHYDVVEAGYKYNMMDIQAALGLHQLARVEENWKRRQEVWDHYQAALRGSPLVLPAEPEAQTRHALHLFPVLVDPERCGLTRDDFLMRINEERIGVGVHYRSLTEYAYYQDTLGWRPEDCPDALRIGRQTVSLPFSAKLTDDDVEDVVAAVQRILRAA